MSARLFAVALLLVLVVVAPAGDRMQTDVGTAAFHSTTAYVDSLIALGAPGLAERTINVSQPADSGDPAWVEWERRRFVLYRHRGQKSAARQRIENMPSSLPQRQRLALRSLAIDVDLHSGDPVGARAQLRQLLWKYRDDPEQQAGWRRRIIEAYLIENRLTDARVALNSYKREYPRPAQGESNADAGGAADSANAEGTTDSTDAESTADSDISLLYARAHLLTGDAGAAVLQLEVAESPEARMMLLLGHLRTGTLNAPEILEEALPLAEKFRIDAALARDLWLLVAAAADGAEDPQLLRARALEQAQLLHRDDLRQPLVPYSLAGLFAAYRLLAEDSVSLHGLVASNEAAWLAVSAALHEAGEKLKARAMHAVLVKDTTDPQVWRIAHSRLLRSWAEIEKSNLFRLVWHLHQGDAAIGDISDIPVALRFQLAQQALVAGRTDITAAFLQEAEIPSAARNPMFWQLRHARMEIYSGKIEAGVSRVLSQVRAHPAFEPEEARRVLRIVFDLQSIDEHNPALLLLNELLLRVSDVELKRQMLYWSADSEFGRKRFEHAADLYLQSALFGSGKGGGFDNWGKSAHIRAALALTEAGLLEDARLLYQALLAKAHSPRERTVVERDIENLQLFKQRRDE